jgi:chromosome segregation ATPase
LRSENQQLAANVAEVELLRRDDAEFKQLDQKITEVRKANDERTRLARLQATQRSTDQNIQAEIDRMNREGNALVNQYKALVALGNDSKQTAEERAKSIAAATQKLAEIQAKQREVQAFIAAARANGPQFEMRRPEPRDGTSAASEISFRKVSRADADSASGVPVPSAEPVRVSFSLPKADLATALSALEHATGFKIVRDSSLTAILGTIDFSAEKLTMLEAAQALGRALHDQLNVVLETNPDGSVVAKVGPPR